ncbi:hypothetical protein FB567DRAFT_547350 [Paraphoma chrysanthemicola]|uniref:Uncharacterized protein n=1 Tax=Paraphoma chrysanthemicola TaxID=798071 RepID=A0A8K0R9R4_9PLEO|nr:hypothetical protein FB567DRAFT_547350 [Paraphoma chrysanthemicola]
MAVFPSGLPVAPPGVDPDVLARINAFMSQTSAQPRLKSAAPIVQNGNAKVQRRPRFVRRETSTTNIGEKKQHLNTAQKEQDGNGQEQLTQGAYDWIKEPPIHIDNNAFDATSVYRQRSIQTPHRFTKSSEPSLTRLIIPTPSLSSIENHEYDDLGRKILARATYPPRPPPLPPRPHHKATQRLDPPTLISLLSMLYVLFLSFFTPATEPGIIEYPTTNMKRSHQVRCEMLVVETNSDTKDSEDLESEEVGMYTQVAYMAHLVVEDGRTEKQSVVSITAKPRRVREILRDDGGRGCVEDVYKREIGGAMRRLCAPRRV